MFMTFCVKYEVRRWELMMNSLTPFV